MPSAYDNVILGDSPLAYWPLNETSGTTVQDLTGNGHTGVYQAGTLAASTFPGDGEPCISSTHANEGPALLTSSGVTLGQSFSLEVWVNLSSASAEWIALAISSQILYGVELPAFQTYYSSAGHAITAASGPTLNQWLHLVGTANSSARVLYVNSVQAVTGTGQTYANLAASAGAAAGGAFATANDGCVGYVAKAAVYNSVLTPTQISNHYAAGTGPPVAVTGQYATHGNISGSVYAVELLGASNTVTVLNRSNTEIYFTLASDGALPSTPAVSGIDSFSVPGVAGASTRVSAGVRPVTVYLTSLSPASYSVYGGQVQPVVER